MYIWIEDTSTLQRYYINCIIYKCQPVVGIKGDDAADSVPWDGVTDKPLSFTPASHDNTAHSETYIPASGVTYENLNANGDVGSTTGTVCAGDDARLSDSRTPTSHGNEAHSSIYLTEIDIHGEDSTDEFSTGDEVLIYDSSLGENRKILRGNFFNGLEGDYISIHGTFEETTPATNMELLVYDPSVPANRRMTRANFLDGISAVGAFTDLTDTPASYEGYDETYYVRVRAGI